MEITKKVIMSDIEKQSLTKAINILASIHCTGINCEDCPLAIIFEYQSEVIAIKCVTKFLKEIK